MDKFRDVPVTSTSPADYAAAVVPSDSADLPVATRAIFVGAGGTLTVTMVGSATPVTFTGMGAGMIYPLRVRRVHTTGTTAANLVALA